MGSGAGKNKRALGSHPGQKAQAAVAARQVVAWDEEKWKQFSRGCGSRNLQEYYMGEIITPLGAKEASKYEQLAREMLLDAVDVGALALPVPYTVEDFKIDVSMIVSSAGIGTHLTDGFISLKSNPDEKQALTPPPAYMHEGFTIASIRVRSALESWAMQIEQLLNKEF